MSEPTKRKHASKRLLVAAIGVATVSYVGTQSGCAADGADAPEDSASSAPYDDEAAPEVASSEQAITLSAAAQKAATTTITLRPRLPPVGNLVPPPGIGDIVVKPPVTIPVPIPVGNLMAPPVVVIHDLPVQVLGK